MDGYARSSHGIVSLDELLSLGLTQEGIARRVRRGSLIRIYEGVYRFPGAPFTWEQGLWAAHKWARGNCVFSHRSALLLHRLAGATDRLVELTVTRKSKAPDSAMVLHYTSRDPFDRATTKRGLPVTSVPRTVLDLAAVLRPWHLETALDDALRHQMTTVEQMWQAVQELGGRGCRGTRLIKHLLDVRSDGRPRSHSTFEVIMDRLLIRSTLPEYFRQFEVMTLEGIPAYVDFAWPDAKLGVEADSFKWHSGRQQWQGDMQRQNALAAVGWLILRFSWYDVTRRPEYVLETIAATLRQRLADR